MEQCKAIFSECAHLDWRKKSGRKKCILQELNRRSNRKWIKSLFRGNWTDGIRTRLGNILIYNSLCQFKESFIHQNHTHTHKICTSLVHTSFICIHRRFIIHTIQATKHNEHQFEGNVLFMRCCDFWNVFTWTHLYIE